MPGIGLGGALTFGFRLFLTTCRPPIAGQQLYLSIEASTLFSSMATRHQGQVGLSLIGGGVSGLRLEDLPQQPSECSLLEVNHYVVRPLREHRLSRFRRLRSLRYGAYEPARR